MPHVSAATRAMQMANISIQSNGLVMLDEMVKLFGRRGALQRHGAKCPL